MPDFFLNAEGGQFAFLKEDDSADWSQAIYRSQTSADSLPADDTDSDVIDTSKLRTIVCLAKPTSATYKILFHGWQDSSQIDDFYVMENGDYTAGYSRSKSIQLDVQSVDAVYPQITEIDGNKLEIEYAPVPYED